MPQIIIISLGGSLIYPSEKGYDLEYLERFKKLILEQIQLGKRFAIIAGGGVLCRQRQAKAREEGITNDEELDMIGIRAAWDNAEFVKSFFGKDADIYPDIVKDYSRDIDFHEDLLFGGGWKPGRSTDFDAVILAEKFNAKRVINLSNIDFVYDKDPKKFKDARAIKEMTWKEFRAIAGDEWNPGLHKPFDPTASKEAESAEITVYVINGQNFENLTSLLEGKEFIGTKIG